LIRGIGLLGGTFLVLNGMIGAGIFALPPEVAAKAGILSPWLFLAAGVLILTVVLRIRDSIAWLMLSTRGN
jgi:APA family basic amino acid/polyamine antiporter